MKNKKIVVPKISKFLEAGTFESLIMKQRDIQDVSFECQDLNKTVSDIEFNGCTFREINFNKNILEKVNFIDCIFDHCDLSNIDFNDRTIHRCIFKHCSLVGCSFINCSIWDVQIINSKCSYINFADCEMRHILLKESIFNFGRLINIRSKDFVVCKCNFKNFEFFDISLAGMDFSDSDIEEILISAKDAKGMIVNQLQGLMLLSLLGIEIKDEI